MYKNEELEEDSRRPGRKRLSMDIPDEVYEEMLKQVERRHCTITKWIVVAILQRLRTEQYYE